MQDSKSKSAVKSKGEIKNVQCCGSPGPGPGPVHALIKTRVSDCLSLALVNTSSIVLINESLSIVLIKINQI